jgi:glyoxylase-like metal-dependent hydrolase (beta-lactamase superfamily II)
MADELNQAKRPAGISRRGFIKTAGVGMAATPSLVDGGLAEYAAPSASTRGVQRISENLYRVEDTCNVYLIIDGNAALVIDFGSGRVLEAARELGTVHIDRVLHTHHHRDQAQGDWKAVREGIPILVPAHERHLFEDAENFWRNRQIYHLYAVRNDFYTLTSNVPVAGVLRDYEKFRWRQHEFLVLPMPGHTAGSIALVGRIDGKKIAFTGDAVHSPGKIPNLYDLQYFYAGTDGVDLLAYSLRSLAEQGPEMLCPSHGDPMREPSEAIRELIEKLEAWLDFWPGAVTARNQPQPVSPHLIAHPQAASAFYAIISDSGKALFVDYGSASYNFFRSFREASGVESPMRFVEHSISSLKARHGLKTIDVAMPSHMHDDHLNGFPHLVRHFGAKIWCYENMVDILENPRGRNIGCVLPTPIRVDRSVRHKESFRWEEFDFTVVHSPGHTDFQMAMFAEIDGTRVAFTGDAFFARNPNNPEEALRHNLIYRNDVQSDSHLRSLRNILEFEPELIAPGHGAPFHLQKDDLTQLEKRLEKQQQHFRSLIADPDTDFGLDPSWVHIYPYQMLIPPGTTKPVQLRVRNHRSRPMELRASLVLPSGWVSSPGVLELSVPAKGQAVGHFSLTVPETCPASMVRVGIAADVVADKKYLGQIAEAVVELRSSWGSA